MNAVIDRVVQYPHRYQLKNVNTGEILGTFDLEPITGTISVVGTKIDKALFDSIANDISARLLSNGGDAKDNVITYTMASDRSNIVSGEKLSVSFGKIAKYINDLKAVAFSGNKSDIGLGNVDNTSDMDKPISNATQKALDLKADKKDVSEVDIDLEGTGTIVSIPENTTGYGTIEKLGGKSYKSVNLLVLKDKAETTINGITYSIKNGVITLNGTATGGFRINLVSGISIANTNGLVLAFWSNNTPSISFEITCSSGEYIYYMQLRNIFSTSTSGSTSKASDNNVIDTIFLWIPSGIVFNNYQLKLMLVSGSNAPTEFSQGFEGIKIEYPTNVKVVTGNICNYDEFLANQYTIANDGSYTSDNTRGCTNYIEIKSKEYKVSFDTQVVFISVAYYDENKTYMSRSIANDSKELNLSIPSNAKYLRFSFQYQYATPLSTTILNNIKPILSYVSQNLPQTNIINFVSNELQTNHSWTQENANKWLGLGVGNDSNIINYANNRKGDVKYSIIDLGTLSFEYNSAQNRYYAPLSNIVIYKSTDLANITCSKYTTTTFYNLQNETTDNIIASYNGYISLRDTSLGTTGTPTGLLIYELATPIEIDLSSLETEEHFECESNGSIIHDNLANYKYSFPVSLKGQVELNFEHDKEQQKQIDKLENNVDELDNNKVPTTRTINGKALNEDINLSASDVGARPSSWTPTKTDVGLGNVNNTSDADKPISNATQNALNNKANSSDLNAHTGNTSNPHSVTKAQVGLGNVDNTKDSDKNVASAKILKNNEIGSFTLSAGIIEGINFNQNSMYLIYNNKWCFIIRIGEKNQYFTIQSTVCYNESTSRPLWFLYQNPDVFRLYLKTTKTVNNNEFVTVYETDETFNYKLLATD